MSRNRNLGRQFNHPEQNHDVVQRGDTLHVQTAEGLACGKLDKAERATTNRPSWCHRCGAVRGRLLGHHENP